MPAERLHEREQRVDAQHGADDFVGERGDPAKKSVGKIAADAEDGARQCRDRQSRANRADGGKPEVRVGQIAHDTGEQHQP